MSKSPNKHTISRLYPFSFYDICHSIEGDLEIISDFLGFSFFSDIAVHPLWRIWTRGLEIVRKEKWEYGTPKEKQSSLHESDTRISHDPDIECYESTRKGESKSIECRSKRLENEKENSKSNPEIESSHTE